MLAALYILIVSGLFVATIKYAPEPSPHPPADPIMGLFILGCYVFGGAIGFLLPETVAPHIGITWGDGPLERTAKIFGAIGGFLIAVRGSVIWGSLFILGILGYGGMMLWGYVFRR